MPKISSTLLGDIEYKTEEVYTFEQGIPGFLNQTKFIFVEVEDSPFTVMHALEEDLYFFLMNPFTLFPEYEFTIPDYALENLQIEEEEDVTCYSVVVLREPLNDSTANMVAPVVLNRKKRRGMQLVLENVGYSVRQPIFVDESTNGHTEEEAIGQQR